MVSAEAALFRDFAVVLLAAGVTALVFYYLKQPVILGYLLAGFIVGPYTWGPSFISNPEVMGFLGELGIVFLLFALGLEFSFSKLRKVGATAIIAGTIEIVLMLLLGYGLGQMFGWSAMQSIFLGAVMSISSTTVIVKVLGEMGKKDEDWARITFGVLIIEDVLAVLILTGLSSAGATGNFQPELLGSLLTKLGIFLGAALLVGLLAAPRIVERLAALKVEEVTVILATGIGFGMALLASHLGFSAGLGAFIAGALMAESPRVAKIAHKIEPLRDVFTAIFFVTVGAAVDPGVLAASWLPILVVTLGVVVGKIVAVSLAVFLTGEAPGKAFRVGMTLAQIGEFAFIIAALGASLGVVPPSLYPIAIAVSALTALLTPHLVRSSPAIAAGLSRRVPVGLKAYASTYGAWIGRLGRSDRRDPEWGRARTAGVTVALTGAVILAIFAGGALVLDDLNARFAELFPVAAALLPLEWLIPAIVAAPFLVVWFQAVRRLVAALARLAVPQRLRRAEATSTERLLRRTLALAATVISAAVAVPFFGFTTGSFLYPLVFAAGGIVVSTAFLGRSLGGFHREVEATLARIMEGTDGAEDAAGSKDVAIRRVESARAWGAGSREVHLPEVSGGGGRTIGQLRLRELTGASVVKVRRGRGAGGAVANPGPEFSFEAGDHVLLIGDDAALTRAEEVLLGQDLGVEGGATEVVVRSASRLVGVPVGEAGFEEVKGVQLLLVRRGGVAIRASQVEKLEAGDVLVVAGPEESVAALAEQARGA